MNSSLRLRKLIATDLPFADSLRAQAGWNQTLADWQRFLAMDPEGCFLAEWNGAPAGTATTTIYGPQLAWIGMVLVDPDYRRRGIGRALLQRCIDYLQGQKVRCIKLDATPLGQPVYAGLGFKDEWTLTRWERAGAGLCGVPASSGMRPWREGDERRIAPLDALAFGVPRQRLMRALAQESRGALVLEHEADQPVAFGLLQNGSSALHLGPIVAASADCAIRLIEALLTRGDAERVLWDIPDPNAAAREWAEHNGFTRQRSLTRMYLGENGTPGDPQKQFALAGPEVG